MRIFAIDPHTGSPEHNKKGQVHTFKIFKKNIKKAKVENMIIPLQKTSKEAAKKFNKKIDLLFIDGRHDYNFVNLDFNLYYPKIKDGGIIVFHDTIGWPGPKRVVKENVFLSKNFRKVRFTNSITYGIKTKKQKLSDRIGNYCFLYLKDISETIRKIKWKLCPIRRK